MKHAFLFLVLSVFFIVCRAQVTEKTPENILENFFKIYEKEGPRAAVDNIYSFGDESMQQSREYVRDTLANTAVPLGGKLLGSELILKKEISPSLLAYTYLVKFNYAPLRLTFIFYKPKDKWMVQHFSFDANVISELYRATRLEQRQ